MDSTPPRYLNVPGNVGPWMAGAIASSIEVGVLLVLTVFYFSQYGRKDHRWCQWLVGLLLFLSAIAWSFNFYVIWEYLITTRSASLASAAASEWGLILATKVFVVPLFIMPFSCVLSQGYFCWRSYKLTGSRRWVGILFAFLMVAGFTVGITTMLVAFAAPGNTVLFNGNDLKNFSDTRAIVKGFWLIMHLLEAFLAITALTDILSTVVLVIYLLPSKQGFNPRTDTVISRILYLSVATGFISSFHSFVDVFLVLGTVHSNNGHIAMCMSQPHCYAAVLVASLLCRKVIDPYENKTTDGVQVADSYGSNSSSAAAGKIKIGFGDFSFGKGSNCGSAIEKGEGCPRSNRISRPYSSQAAVKHFLGAEEKTPTTKKHHDGGGMNESEDQENPHPKYPGLVYTVEKMVHQEACKPGSIDATVGAPNLLGPEIRSQLASEESESSF